MMCSVVNAVQCRINCLQHAHYSNPEVNQRYSKIKIRLAAVAAGCCPLKKMFAIRWKFFLESELNSMEFLNITLIIILQQPSITNQSVVVDVRGCDKLTDKLTD